MRGPGRCLQPGDYRPAGLPPWRHRFAGSEGDQRRQERVLHPPRMRSHAGQPGERLPVRAGSGGAEDARRGRGTARVQTRSPQVRGAGYPRDQRCAGVAGGFRTYGEVGGPSCARMHKAEPYATYSVAAQGEVDAGRNQEEYGSHRQGQYRVFHHAGRDPREDRRKPGGRCAAAPCKQAYRANEGDYLNRDHGAVGSLRGFAPRAKLSQPPDTARIGYDRTSAQFFARGLDDSGDGSHVGADLARGHMRAQLGVNPVGPAGLKNGGQHLRLEFALHWCHDLLPSEAPPNRAASLRRAPARVKRLIVNAVGVLSRSTAIVPLPPLALKVTVTNGLLTVSV